MIDKKNHMIDVVLMSMAFLKKTSKVMINENEEQRYTVKILASEIITTSQNKSEEPREI